MLECEARPGQFLTTFGGSSSFEAPCGVFRKPSADLSPFHLRVLPVKGGFQIRWTNLALGHHGWTGKFGAAGGTVQQVAVGVDGDAGTVARISDHDPEMLRYFDSVGITLDSHLRVVARRDFAGMISVAVTAADDSAESTVDLGNPAAEAIWVVA